MAAAPSRIRRARLTSRLVALALGIALSLALERAARPAAPGLSRRLPAFAIHASLFTLTALALDVLLSRPFLSASLVLSGGMLLVLVNNAKWRALREPLVHSDLALFAQAIRYPRLYLPYLDPAPVAIASALFVAAMVVGWMLEAPTPVPPAAASVGAILAAGALAWGTRSAAPALLIEPERDVARDGLVVSLWLYAVRERTAPERVPAGTPFAIATGRNAARLPHIVAVQSESFFDARRLYDGVADAVLRNFDALRDAGVSGRLEVPAWGAYTMRTEFAFLSGVAPGRLGVHRFNPYRRLARRALPTLASQLRALGYRTVCVHPYPAAFFRRDLVIPLLGFDEFLDLKAFAQATRDGPYVADAEVARKVGTILERASGPQFVFAITMENHGPLHLERAREADVAALYRRAPPEEFGELTVYLRHLRNADAMLGELAAALAGDGVLCAFGDHLPSMPRVYDACAYTDSRTDYVLWRAGHATPRREDVAADGLGGRLLKAAGLDVP